MTAFSLTRFKEASHWLTQALIVVGASIVITLFGQLSIPLPFSPVPLATQGTFCLMLALLIGSRNAALAVSLFILEGVMGLPVFSLGKSGFWHLMGPTGGYIVGMLLGTYLAGALFERSKNRGVSSAFLAMAAGNAVIFLCGWSHLSLFVGAQGAFLLGVLPFLIGDALKLLLATQLACGINNRFRK